MLKSKYITTQAFGVVDLGIDNAPRFAVVLLDVDRNGIADTKEKKAIKATLYSTAIKEGGTPLTDSRGMTISVNSCLKFNAVTANKVSDDMVLVFNKGDIVDLSTLDISFAMLHFLLDNGYLE